jgi:hypothetical protein
MHRCKIRICMEQKVFPLVREKSENWAQIQLMDGSVVRDVDVCIASVFLS